MRVTDDGVPHIDVSHYAEGGPVAAVWSFLEQVFDARSFAGAWALLDENLRTCRAQAWLFNNRQHFGGEAALPALLPGLVTGSGASPHWRDFASIELAQLQEAWGESYGRGLGAASGQRPIGVDLEIVLLMPIGDEVVLVTEPTLVLDGLSFVVRRVGPRFEVAAYGDFVPEPGWPPTLQPPTGR